MSTKSSRLFEPTIFRPLLAFYEDKGMLALAARHLKDSKRESFKAWLERILRKDSAPALNQGHR